MRGEGFEKQSALGIGPPRAERGERRLTLGDTFLRCVVLGFKVRVRTVRGRGFRV